MLHFLCFLLLLNEKDRENEGFFLTQKAQKFTDTFLGKSIAEDDFFFFMCCRKRLVFSETN